MLPLRGERSPRRAAALWLAVSFGALWISGAAHELGHILPYLLLSIGPFGERHPMWTRLLISAGGPAVTGALLLLACRSAALKNARESAGSWRAPWAVGIGAAAGLRSVALAPAALLLLGGRQVGIRPDELRIGRLVGVPMESLILAELVLTLICWGVIWRRAGNQLGRHQVGGLLAGLLLGAATWMAIAYGFDIGMMK